jgi:hypothetical protein
MTTLVLHIGSPKTGSSAIQAAIPERRLRWRSSGWCVPPANPYGRAEPAGFIANLYADPEDLPRVWAVRAQARSQRLQRDIARYRKILASCLEPRWRRQPQALFISSEYLWGLPADAIRKLKQDCRAWGVSRFLVIAYVRSPIDFYRSSLQQHARLSTAFRRFRPQRWRYRFRQRLEAWEQMFGSDFLVRPYDRPQLHQGCVVQDLLHQISQHCPDLPLLKTPAAIALKPSAVAATNASVCTEELVAMQEWMASQGVGAQPEGLRASKALWRQWTRLPRRVDCSQGTPVQLKADVARVLQQRHTTDLDWLQCRYGITLPGVNLPAAEGPCEQDVWPESLRVEDLLEAERNDALLQYLRQELSRRSLPGA